jgi:hypothetical protein
MTKHSIYHIFSSSSSAPFLHETTPLLNDTLNRPIIIADGNEKKSNVSVVPYNTSVPPPPLIFGGDGNVTINNSDDIQQET